MSMAAKYSEAERPDTREMVERYTPLVKRVAYHLMGRMPASVQLDDLIQADTRG